MPRVAPATTGPARLAARGDAAGEVGGAVFDLTGDRALDVSVQLLEGGLGEEQIQGIVGLDRLPEVARDVGIAPNHQVDRLQKKLARRLLDPLPQKAPRLRTAATINGRFDDLNSI